MKQLTIILVLLFIGNFQFLNAQEFADKKFYLVDSLNLESLTKEDKTVIDSSLTNYHNTKNDSIKLFQLNHLITNCENKIWMKYNDFLMKKSLKLIEKAKNNKTLINFYKKNIASYYNNLGYYYFGVDDYQNAVFSFEEAITISKEIDDLTVIPTALNNIGFIFKQQGDILRALEYYHQSLKLNKALKEKEEIALALNNIGGVYFKLEEYDKALNYYREALLIEKESGTQKGIARLYSNIGSVYTNQEKKKEAIDYFNQSLKIYKELQLKKGIATSLSKIAVLEMSLVTDNTLNKNSILNHVLLKHKEAYQIYSEIEDNEGKAYSLKNISLTYKELGDLSSSYDFANRSLAIAKKIGFPESIKNAAEILKDVAYHKREFKEAYDLQELYYKMQDSISSLSIKEATLQKQFQYEYEKKLLADSIKNVEKEKIIQAEITAKDEKIKRQTIERYGLSGGILVLLLFGSFVFMRYKESQKQKIIINHQKEIVEAKTKEITDSINYAKNIQNSILPTEEEFESTLKNSFIYYQPKDIVAGDFYWMESPPSSQKEGETIYFAAADCTGHGVPGAMVSVVCNGALNRAIGEYNLKQPAEILNKVRELVIKTFERSGDDSKLRDGMDIALCSIQLSENYATLQYAGANNPLWIIRPVNNLENKTSNFELVEIKADKQPIGKHFRQNNFTNHTVSLQKGDTIYIFTDGYADQFGGPKGKKMMYKPFKEFLISIQDKNMQEQKIAVQNHFNQWKGDLEQVDDVCVIAVSV
ncbi:MAG: tetratricopeptide repeat protein [Flavobacteriales bacterium]|nr:tetratricopeptide repeat protein [Flavobacteriales bacterium]